MCSNGEAMEQLAKVDVLAAAACPNCRQRVTDLNLDELAGGAQHQCLFCGSFMNIPQSIIDKLLAQREMANAAAQENRSLFSRLAAFFSRLLGK